MNKLGQMERKLKELQQEIEALKKQGQEASSDLPAMLPPVGTAYDEDGIDWVVMADGYGNFSEQNSFPDEATATAYEGAFSVMLELRRQPGSGMFEQKDVEDPDAEIGCFYINQDGLVLWTYLEGAFELCPPFPSEALAQKAIEAVGRERIMKTYEVLKCGHDARKGEV